MVHVPKHRPRSGLAERTIAEALRSLAMPLGCPVAYLEQQRAALVQRLCAEEASSPPVVRTFVRHDVGLVSLPCADQMPLTLDPADVQELIAFTRLEAEPGTKLTLGSARLTVKAEPAGVRIADAGTISEARACSAMLVYEPGRASLDELRSDVSHAEWDDHACEDSATHRVGAMHGGMLVALASVERPHGQLARIRVLVSPTFRQSGLGRLVMRTLAQRVLAQGLFPYVRLTTTDLAARALSSTVGFVGFARTLTWQVSPTMVAFA